MAYEQRSLRRQKVRYSSDNDDNALTYQLVLNGAKVTPTSATIAVYKPGTSTAVLAATAMTVSGTLMTYALDTTTTADFPLDEGYRADIVVTYGGVTYNRHIMFDVVSYLLRLDIGRDQLVALDDQLNAAEFGGDDDFSELIDACRDDLSVMIEAHVIDDDKLLENMILDSSAVSPAARYYILQQYFRAHGETDKADNYESKFKDLFRSALSTIRYDKTQDGEEDADIGGALLIRVTT